MPKRKYASEYIEDAERKRVERIQQMMASQIAYHTNQFLPPEHQITAEHIEWHDRGILTEQENEELNIAQARNRMGMRSWTAYYNTPELRSQCMELYGMSPEALDAIPNTRPPSAAPVPHMLRDQRMTHPYNHVFDAWFRNYYHGRMPQYAFLAGNAGEGTIGYALEENRRIHLDYEDYSHNTASLITFDEWQQLMIYHVRYLMATYAGGAIYRFEAYERHAERFYPRHHVINDPLPRNCANCGEHCRHPNKDIYRSNQCGRYHPIFYRNSMFLPKIKHLLQWPCVACEHHLGEDRGRIDDSCPYIACKYATNGLVHYDTSYFQLSADYREFAWKAVGNCPAMDYMLAKYPVTMKYNELVL